MGLDLALGGILLLSGIRGWFKGFIMQAIRLAGVVGCVYAAAPMRDAIRPRVIAHFSAIKPDLADRILWWVCGFVCYFLMVGVASLLVNLSRRKTLGEPEPNYNDHFAGFLLGLIKGTLVAAFLVAAVQKYALAHLKSIPWAEQQVTASKALEWNEKYQPATKVWESRPVQHFVNHIQKMGIQPADDAKSESAPVASADRPPQLSLPAATAELVDPNMAHLVESIQDDLRKLEQSTATANRR